MSSSHTQPTDIGHCPKQRQAEALELIFAQRDGAERDAQIKALLKSVRSGTGSLDFLFEARRAGRLVGAALASAQPGRTAILWLPGLVAGEPENEAVELIEAVLAKVAKSPIRLAQALLPVDATNDASRLEEAGFFQVAELLYLACQEGAFMRSQVECQLDFEAYRPRNQLRFRRVIEATYKETLDCPRLDGVREITDILAGYRAMGVFSADRWLLARHEGQDVGCLLLSDYPEQDQWELVYMGVLPSWRGRGWGLAIVRHAQWLVGRGGRKRLVLAVDAANHPALRLYGEAGFQAWARRRAYLKVLSGQAGECSDRGGSAAI